MPHNQYQIPVGTPAEAQKVEELLGEIMVCFEDAERVSQRFKTKSSNFTELQVYDARCSMVGVETLSIGWQKR